MPTARSPHTLDVTKIRGISLDLDDTLWPIWPTIERAEKALLGWVDLHAPRASRLFADAAQMRAIREEIGSSRPELQHDLSAVRHELIRLALLRADADSSLADGAFDVFFAERQRVTLYDDALDALEFLSARFPLVSLSNGNADLERVGLARFFQAEISARKFGFAKPDSRIFMAAADALNLAPEQVLHIGDDATLDGLGALDAGMQSAWLNRADHLWPHDAAPHVTLTGLDDLVALFRGPA